MSIKCKRCGSDSWVKNGMVQGVQRYKCKSCAYNYINRDKRQKYTEADRLEVLKLYLENCGIRTIERLTGIRNSQISKWILKSAEDLQNEISKAKHSVNSIKDIEILEIDELCTYIKKDPKMAGNLPSDGLLLIGTKVKLLTLR